MKVEGVYDEHGETLIMWMGDVSLHAGAFNGAQSHHTCINAKGWQQAFDLRKEHDPQWWAPLSFDVTGRINNFSRIYNWTYDNSIAKII